MFTFLSTWKYALLAGLALVWSVCVWHVAVGYTSNSFTEQKLQQAQELIHMQNYNDQLADRVATQLQAALNAADKQRDLDKKDLLDALKDSRYADCTNTDSVRNLYQRKLQAQH